MYLDANNLYGWTMSQNLPTGGFKWVKNDEWGNVFVKKEDGGYSIVYDKKKDKENKIKKKIRKKDIGYFIECDLEYPENLHDLHNDYPLAPEKLVVQDEWLSPYCKNIKDEFNLPTDKTTKLIPTLFNKEKYVLHIRNLNFYLQLVMKLTKIHRVLQFEESPWLEKYISFNTKKRADATNNFEKEFFQAV